MSKNKNKRTNIVQAALGSDPAYHSIIPPLYLSSTFQTDSLQSKGAYEYSRTANPTRDLLADALTRLEGGAGTCVTSSGMAALTLILHLLNPEDLIIAPYDCYGRSHRLMSALAEKKHFRLKFIDQYPGDLDEMFSEAPRMVLIESPSNPLMRIADIQAIADRAKKHGAITVVDNTFLSPILQEPLKLGADLSYHSTTKFLNGHSDVVGGAVVAANEALYEELAFWNNSLGTTGAPFDSYMTLRGLRTLDVRVHRAGENAAQTAAYLNAHDGVESVYYPGLPGHPGHETAKKQQSGFGAMLSIDLNADFAAVEKFVQSLEVFRLAQSLGGTESLINHPATMTHVSMGDKARAAAGITDRLLRLSVGIEHIDDLIADLDQAFAKIGKAKAA